MEANRKIITGCLIVMACIVLGAIAITLIIGGYQIYTLNQEKEEILQELRDTNMKLDGLMFESESLRKSNQLMKCKKTISIDYQLQGDQAVVSLMEFVRTIPGVINIETEEDETGYGSIDNWGPTKLFWFSVNINNEQNRVMMFSVYPEERGTFWINEGCWLDPLDGKPN